MKGSKIKERVCPACNGTGYPVVMQPMRPGRKLYPVKCKSCGGKGKITDTEIDNPSHSPGLKSKSKY